MSNRPLTERQRRFIDAYIEMGVGLRAATKAGYAGNPKVLSITVAKLLGSASVQSELARRQAIIAKRNDVTIDSIVQRLNEIAERCLQLTPVHDRKGNLVEGEWQFDAAGANRALELLGKHLGMFPRDHTTVNIDARQQVIATLAGMSTEQLLTLASGASETLPLESRSD